MSEPGGGGPLAVFVGLTGWRAAFLWLGAITIVLALMTLLLVRNRPKDMNLPNMNEIDGIYVDPKVQADDDALTFAATLKIALTNWNFWWLAIYAFAVYGPMMGFQGLWAAPLYDGRPGYEQAAGQ
jgi:sugar phosphate permease